MFGFFKGSKDEYNYFDSFEAIAKLIVELTESLYAKFYECCIIHTIFNDRI